MLLHQTLFLCRNQWHGNDVGFLECYGTTSIPSAALLRTSLLLDNAWRYTTCRSRLFNNREDNTNSTFADGLSIFKC